MADPKIAGFLAAFFAEVLPTVDAVPGIDLDGYCSTLVRRFSNVHIKDTVLRLAEDGSQKLQTTMRPVLLDHIASGAPCDVMGLAIAGWVRFMAGVDDDGAPIEGIKDPRKDELQEASRAVVASPSTGTVAALLHAFFGDSVGRNEHVIGAVLRGVSEILAQGTASALARFAASP
jgi:mannitol 2-dehydrogenase